MANKRRSIALITGGSRGLGRSMATHLSARGTDVVVTYREQANDAQRVVEQARASGARAGALQLDVGVASSFGAFAETLRAELGQRFETDRLDFLVNNAGVGVHAPYAETTEAQLDLLIDVHFKGPFLLTQTLLPVLADGGRVLNVSSGLARFTFPGYAG